MGVHERRSIRGIVQVNFADMRMSVSFTRDFFTWLPVEDEVHLVDLAWL
jgi:hypothetical protein